MKKSKLLILLILPLFLSGCYNYRELNDLGITTAFSIDYDSENDNFKVIAQIINPVKQQDAGAGDEPTFVNYQSEAKSLQEAFRLIILESPKQLYGSQLQLFIISENALDGHLHEILDFFIRDPEFRSEFKILIAKNDESLKGISIQTVLDNLSSSNILNSLEIQSEIEGIASLVSLNDLTNMYLNPYLEITLPSMIIEGNVEEGEEKNNVTTTVRDASVKISTMGIFKDDKLIGYLSLDESRALNLIKGEVSDTILTLNIDDSYIVFEPNRIKTKLEADVKKNKVKITIDGFSRINEVSSMVNLKDPKEIERLQKELNKNIEKTVKDTFYKIRDDYNTDVFGFRDLYYKTDHKYFKKNYQNWYEDVFPNLEIEVSSNLKLYEKGNTLGGTKYERKDK